VEEVDVAPGTPLDVEVTFLGSASRFLTIRVTRGSAQL
jgi:hypothetical protein